MEIKDWIELNGYKKCAIARILGVDKVTLWSLCTKRRWPRPKLAKKIEELTNGQVTNKDLTNFVPMAQQKRESSF